MDWIVLAWTIFVAVVYVGGYFFPSNIGIYTGNLSAGYAVFLIAGVTAWALRLRAGRQAEQPVPSTAAPTSTKRGKR